MKVLNGLFAFLLVLNLSAQDRDANYINYMTSPQAPKVEGKGSAIEEPRIMKENIEKIIVGNGIQLFVLPGEEQNVKVVAQSNVLPLVKTELVEGTLMVALTASVETRKGIKIYLSQGQLSKITIIQGGWLFMPEPIESETLTLLLQSGAVADCKLNLNRFSCTVMGGSILNISGKARTLSDLVVQGGSNLNGEHFECVDCKTIILGASKCKMKVLESMDARVENESVFTYIGNPTSIKKSTSLNGQIRQINN